MNDQIAPPEITSDEKTMATIASTAPSVITSAPFS